MAQAAYNAIIKTAGITTVFSTSETFTNVSGAIYQIDDVTKRVWDRDVVPTVYVGSAASTPTAIDYLFGKVTLSTTGTVTASGNYLPMSEKASFNNYSIALSGEVLDKTTFDNNAGCRRRQVGLLDASITLSGFQDPWFFNYTDTTANLETAIAVSGDPSTFSITTGSSVAAGEIIRINDELFLVTTITAVSTTQSAVIATRAQRGSVEAAHTTDADVFEMNGSHFSRNAFITEILPGGSTDDIWRLWVKAESLEDSGAIGDLVQNSISLQLDGSAKSAMGRNI